MNPQVDAYLEKTKAWKEELTQLRGIALEAGLTEEFKWGKPCYSYQGSNVAVLAPFKERCAFIFANGALLKDAGKHLIRPTENTQAARQWRFKSLAEIEALAPEISAYLAEAIAAEKAGLKVQFKDISEHVVPDELQQVLDTQPDVKTAFEALTPGRRRAYMLHISGAKQAKTREARVEKCLPRILAGKGIDE